MRCNSDAHSIAECNFRFCHKCGELVDKDEHICFVKPNNNFKPPNQTTKESQSAEIRNAWFEKSTSNSDTNRGTSRHEINNSGKNISEVNITSSSISRSSPPLKVSSTSTISKKNDEYLGRKVVLQKGGGAKSRTPPSKPEETSQKPLSSIWGKVENVINLSSPEISRLELTKLAPILYTG